MKYKRFLIPSCPFALGLIHSFARPKLQEEKIAAVQAKLEHAEQELAQFAKLPEMEEQLKQRMEALTQVRRPNQVRRGIHFHHIKIFPLYDHHSCLCHFFLFLSCRPLSCLTLSLSFLSVYYSIRFGGGSEPYSRSTVMFVVLEISFLDLNSFIFDLSLVEMYRHL